MFKGPIAALVTPFRDGSIDEAAFRSLVEWQITEGRMPGVTRIRRRLAGAWCGICAAFRQPCGRSHRWPVRMRRNLRRDGK